MAAMHQAAPLWVSQMHSIGSSVEGRPINAICIGQQACKELEVTGADATAAGSGGIPRYRAGLLLTAMHHAREPLGASAMLSFGLDIVRRLVGGDASTAASLARMGGGLWLLPCANPDAYVINIEALTWNDASPPVPRTRTQKDGIMARKNRRPGCAQPGWGGSSETVGVDTNRNYDFYWAVDDQGSSPNVCAEDYRGPSPFSEPESSAVAALVERVPFSVALNLHSYGRFINLPYAVQRLGSPPTQHYALFLSLASQLGAATGFGFGHPWSGGLYSVNGEASDWMWARGGVLAMSPELGPFMEFNPFERGMWPAEADLPALTSEATALLHTAWALTGPRPQISLAGSNAQGQPGQAWAPGDLVELRLSVTNGGAVDFSGQLRVAALPLDDGLLAFAADELADAVAAAAGLTTPSAALDSQEAQSGAGAGPGHGTQQPKPVIDASNLLGRSLSTTWAALLSSTSGSSTTGNGFPAVCAGMDLPRMPAGQPNGAAGADNQPLRRRRLSSGASASASGADTGLAAAAGAVEAQRPLAAHAQALAAMLKGRAGAALEAQAEAQAAGAVAGSNQANQWPLEQRISLQRSLEELLAYDGDGSLAASAGRELSAGDNAPTPAPVPVATGSVERTIATSSAGSSDSSGSSSGSGSSSRAVRYSFASVLPWTRVLPAVDNSLADAVPAAASVPGLGAPLAGAASSGSGSGNGQQAHAHAPAGQGESLTAVLPPTLTTVPATFAFTVAAPPASPGASGGDGSPAAAAGALPQITPPQLLQVTLPAPPISPAVAAQLTPEQQAARGARVSLVGALVVSDDLLCWVFGITSSGKVSSEPLAVLQAACPPCAALRAGKEAWAPIAVAAAVSQNLMPPLSGGETLPPASSPPPSEPQASPAPGAAASSPAAAAASPAAGPGASSVAPVPSTSSGIAAKEDSEGDTGSGPITGSQLAIIAGGAILGVAAGFVATRALARRLLREPDDDALALGGSSGETRRRRGTGAAAAAVRATAASASARAGAGLAAVVGRGLGRPTAYERVAEVFDEEEDEDGSPGADADAAADSERNSSAAAARTADADDIDLEGDAAAADAEAVAPVAPIAPVAVAKRSRKAAAAKAVARAPSDLARPAAGRLPYRDDPAAEAEADAEAALAVGRYSDSPEDDAASMPSSRQPKGKAAAGRAV